MLGTWRWNAALGILGLGLTFLFSIGNNPLSVVMLRGLYAFSAFFVLAYVARTILALILKPPVLVGESPDAATDSNADEMKGSQLDLSTPDESDNLNEMLKSQLQGGHAASSGYTDAQKDAQFRPLAPPQFVSTTNKQPEELAKAVRHLTGE